MVDDDRLPVALMKRLRSNACFRTLLLPTTGAVESNADDLSDCAELLNSRTSERQGRAIDSDSSVPWRRKA